MPYSKERLRELHLDRTFSPFLRMLNSLFENPVLSILALLVLSCILGLHVLLFQEYIKQERIQGRRLKELERLVKIELGRSQVVENQIELLDRIKSQTADKLELIKLQVAAMKAKEKEEEKKGNSN